MILLVIKTRITKLKFSKYLSLHHNDVHSVMYIKRQVAIFFENTLYNIWEAANREFPGIYIRSCRAYTNNRKWQLNLACSFSSQAHERSNSN